MLITRELIDQTKAVPMPHILAEYEIMPAKNIDPHAQRAYYLYFASYRNEKHPSLSVYINKKGEWLFKDHATGEYGTNLDILIKFGLATDWREAVELIAKNQLGMFARLPDIRHASIPNKKVEQEKTCCTYAGHIIEIRQIKNSRVETYITNTRFIPLDIADKYLRFITYSYPPNPRIYHGIGWPTVHGGWAVRWAVDMAKGGKTFIGPAGISCFQCQTNRLSDKCLVFEGVFDFLSYASSNEVCCDVIVLNSAANATSANNALTRYVEIECFPDHDEIGQAAFNTIHRNNKHAYDSSHIYSAYKDYNEYWVNINRKNKTIIY